MTLQTAADVGSAQIPKTFTSWNHYPLIDELKMHHCSQLIEEFDDFNVLYKWEIVDVKTENEFFGTYSAKGRNKNVHIICVGETRRVSFPLSLHPFRVSGQGRVWLTVYGYWVVLGIVRYPRRRNLRYLYMTWNFNINCKRTTMCEYLCHNYDQVAHTKYILNWNSIPSGVIWLTPIRLNSRITVTSISWPASIENTMETVKHIAR